MLACQAPLELQASAHIGGLSVQSSRPVTEFRLLDAQGNVRWRQRLPAPSTEAELTLSLPAGEWTLAAETAQVHLTIAALPPLTRQIQRHPGGEWEELQPEMTVVVPEGGQTEVLLGLTGGPGMPASVAVEPGGPMILAGQGQRGVRRLEIGQVPVDIQIDQQHFRLIPKVLSTSQLKAQLQIQPYHFPSDANGHADPGRPKDEIQLPSPAWAWLTPYTRSSRRQDQEAPWAWLSVPIENSGTEDINLVLCLHFDDPAFRPRLRESDAGTGDVTVLLRVPAQGQAVAALPVFVDTQLIQEGNAEGVLSIHGLGSSEAIDVRPVPLWVRRGDSVAGLGLLTASLTALGGWLWTLKRLKNWLRTSSTAELMAIALFGSALFVVGSVNDLATVSLSALLGPFSTIVTGIFGEISRMILLGSLLGLRPRPGTLSLAILCGWLLRGLLMGSFTIGDPLFVGVSIAAGEGFSYLAGLSRGIDWLAEGQTQRWLRLSLAFGGASVCSSLAGIWFHTVLYRLFFADWYIGLQIGILGMVYPAMAAWLAAGLVRSLRDVSP